MGGIEKGWTSVERGSQVVGRALKSVSSGLESVPKVFERSVAWFDGGLKGFGRCFERGSQSVLKISGRGWKGLEGRWRGLEVVGTGSGGGGARV